MTGSPEDNITDLTQPIPIFGWSVLTKKYFNTSLNQDELMTLLIKFTVNDPRLDFFYVNSTLPNIQINNGTSNINFDNLTQWQYLTSFNLATGILLAYDILEIPKGYLITVAIKDNFQITIYSINVSLTLKMETDDFILINITSTTLITLTDTDVLGVQAVNNNFWIVGANNTLWGNATNGFNTFNLNSVAVVKVADGVLVSLSSANAGEPCTYYILKSDGTYSSGSTVFSENTSALSSRFQSIPTGASINNYLCSNTTVYKFNYDSELTIINSELPFNPTFAVLIQHENMLLIQGPVNYGKLAIYDLDLNFLRIVETNIYFSPVNGELKENWICGIPQLNGTEELPYISGLTQPLISYNALIDAVNCLELNTNFLNTEKLKVQIGNINTLQTQNILTKNIYANQINNPLNSNLVNYVKDNIQARNISYDKSYSNGKVIIGSGPESINSHFVFNTYCSNAGFVNFVVDDYAKYVYAVNTSNEYFQVIPSELPFINGPVITKSDTTGKIIFGYYFNYDLTINNNLATITVYNKSFSKSLNTYTVILTSTFLNAFSILGDLASNTEINMNGIYDILFIATENTIFKVHGKTGIIIETVQLEHEIINVFPCYEIGEKIDLMSGILTLDNSNNWNFIINSQSLPISSNLNLSNTQTIESYAYLSNYTALISVYDSSVNISQLYLIQWSYISLELSLFSYQSLPSSAQHIQLFNLNKNYVMIVYFESLSNKYVTNHGFIISLSEPFQNPINADYTVSVIEIPFRNESSLYVHYLLDFAVMANYIVLITADFDPSTVQNVNGNIRILEYQDINDALTINKKIISSQDIQLKGGLITGIKPNETFQNGINNLINFNLPEQITQVIPSSDYRIRSINSFAVIQHSFSSSDILTIREFPNNLFLTVYSITGDNRANAALNTYELTPPQSGINYLTAFIGTNIYLFPVNQTLGVFGYLNVLNSSMQPSSDYTQLTISNYPSINTLKAVFASGVDNNLILAYDNQISVYNPDNQTFTLNFECTPNNLDKIQIAALNQSLFAILTSSGYLSIVQIRSYNVQALIQQIDTFFTETHIINTNGQFLITGSDNNEFLINYATSSYYGNNVVIKVNFNQYSTTNLNITGRYSSPPESGLLNTELVPISNNTFIFQFNKETETVIHILNTQTMTAIRKIAFNNYVNITSVYNTFYAIYEINQGTTTNANNVIAFIADINALDSGVNATSIKSSIGNFDNITAYNANIKQNLTVSNHIQTNDISIVSTLSSNSANIAYLTSDDISCSGRTNTNHLLAGTLSTESATVTNSLTAGTLSTESAIVTNSLTAGNITITDTITAGTLSTESATVTNSLTAGTLSTENATVTNSLSAGTLSTESATITNTLSAGTLSTENATVTNSLSAGTLSTENATVTNTLSTENATVTNTLSTESATITNSLTAGTLSTENATVAHTLSAVLAHFDYLNSAIKTNLRRLSVESLLSPSSASFQLTYGSTNVTINKCSYYLFGNYILLTLAEFNTYTGTNLEGTSYPFLVTDMSPCLTITVQINNNPQFQIPSSMINSAIYDDVVSVTIMPENAPTSNYHLITRRRIVANSSNSFRIEYYPTYNNTGNINLWDGAISGQIVWGECSTSNKRYINHRRNTIFFNFME